MHPLVQLAHPVAALAGVGAVAGAVLWLVLGGSAAGEIAPPRVTDQDRPVGFSADLPPLRPLASYTGKGQAWADLNPFIPNEQRERENRLAEVVRNRPIRRPQPLPQREAKPPPLPTWVAPPDAGLGDATLPVVLTYVGDARRGTALVQVGQQGPLPIGPGDSVGGWRLLAVEGNQARFVNEAGSSHEVPVGASGMGSDNIVPIPEGAEKTPAPGSQPSKPSKPAPAPQAKAPAAPASDTGRSQRAGAAAGDGRKRLTLDSPEVQAYLNAHPQLKKQALSDPARAQAFIDNMFKQ
jgi:hypothetical protein